jgi:hypothetical protein
MTNVLRGPPTTNAMHDSSLPCHGSFRYNNHDALDRALCEVRDHLDDVELSDDESTWLRSLTRRGMTLVVAASLPRSADRHVAAAVLGALAQTAVEGHVDVTIGSQLVDAFVCEAGC